MWLTEQNAGLFLSNNAVIAKAIRFFLQPVHYFFGILTSTHWQDTALEVYECLECGGSDFKLLYVTPEKLSKSKKLMSLVSGYV